MIILGVHCGFTLFNHEPGAAVSINGKIVSSCEEERAIQGTKKLGASCRFIPLKLLSSLLK